MEYPDFMADKRLQEAADVYKAKFGGRFGGEEPGVRLVRERRVSIFINETKANDSIVQNCHSLAFVSKFHYHFSTNILLFL